MQSWKGRARWVVVMGAVILGACAGQVGADEATTRGAAGAATRAGLLPIRYERTGGFAGTRDVVEITPAGEVVVVGKIMKSGKGRLTAEQVSALAGAFAGWETLKESYPSPGNLRDGFVYKVRYGTKEVTVGDGNKEVPGVFEKARAAVEGVVAGVGK